jgi:hypothetical protein
VYKPGRLHMSNLEQPIHDSNTRTVYECDALLWFAQTALPVGSSVVASLPDISEFPQYTLAQWQQWFIDTATLILAKTPEYGVTIFYQSDIKHEGTWIDKGYLAQKAAEKEGSALLWHKIICRVPPGLTTFKRSSYTHILCFSKRVRADLSKSTPDVLPEMGEKTWARGMGFEACLLIARFIKEQTTSTTLVHPFCGQGSMLAMAQELGLSAIGIERSKKCAALARKLRANVKERRWIFPE